MPHIVLCCGLTASMVIIYRCGLTASMLIHRCGLTASMLIVHCCGLTASMPIVHRCGLTASMLIVHRCGFTASLSCASLANSIAQSVCCSSCFLPRATHSSTPPSHGLRGRAVHVVGGVVPLLRRVHFAVVEAHERVPQLRLRGATLETFTLLHSVSPPHTP